MDPWAQAFSEIGADFEALMAPLLAPVTVAQIDPDTGSATTTAENVPGLKRGRRRQPFGVGGGEFGDDACRFVFRISTAGFTPKARDQIVDAIGITWIVEKVDLIAFNQLAACDVIIKR